MARAAPSRQRGGLKDAVRTQLAARFIKPVQNGPTALDFMPWICAPCTLGVNASCWFKICALIFTSVQMHRDTILQVENEETFEALSARPKALLDEIQQRFSICAIEIELCVLRERFT